MKNVKLNFGKMYIIYANLKKKQQHKEKKSVNYRV